MLLLLQVKSLQLGLVAEVIDMQLRVTALHDQFIANSPNWSAQSGTLNSNCLLTTV